MQLATASTASATTSVLQAKVDNFRRDIEAHLPKDGQKVAFVTSWLATDNVFIALMHKYFPEALAGLNLVAIDTLHLFPETLECARLVQERYGKLATWKRPSRASTIEEFEAMYGTAEDLDSAEFDYISKVEPLQRALKECRKDILVTSRRMDQTDRHMRFPVWEAGRRTLNPLAEFSWKDVIACVDKYEVPISHAHSYAFRCTSPIEAARRHQAGLPCEKAYLGKPFWQATEEELRGSPPVPNVYVFKSFGDAHTTVPVEPQESERAGRFVRQPVAAERRLHSIHQGAVQTLPLLPQQNWSSNQMHMQCC